MLERRSTEITVGRVAKAVKKIIDQKLQEALTKTKGDAQTRHAEKRWSISERTVRTYLKNHSVHMTLLGVGSLPQK
jgi:hypothetical protein